MAAFEDFHMPASLAVVHNAGALSLELPKPERPGCEASPASSPMAISPWATSTEACNSPWSPVTPAVHWTKRASFGSCREAVAPQMWNNAMVPASSPFFPSPATHPNYPVAAMQQSPAMSPTSEIRSNAVSFGIPLQTDMGKVGAPLPIRTMSGILVAPSPTARGSVPPVAPIVRHQEAPAATAAPAMVTGGVQPASMQIIRSMATPFMGAQTRRAAGGA
mmetsp:Transcript_8395/g.15738  ORF Transcript_8395/g.15738 Transcript_8395/m.15738 type:complete len:220 (+) Transcript_8395:63-722(+)|eukprot:CAMPEP_0172713632 /NCGR_PEP_ID=MMETSP1074-20121228/63133_1 /TAXON_ID=2916 /ORGANISM="Ceratium fusus, Strain PA161109" /LENGTH=219 /DNA_ID=CAMNT_0013537785 /DNA_START=62 /DNA_END=721 /DNA_ORIENTATION=+